MARILVIDDESSILESLEMFLGEKGHAVVKAATAAEGLAAFGLDPADIVILDIRLPDINGLDVLSELQKNGDPAKVIMITAFHDMETTIEAMKRGAYDYIRKPLDADEVEKAVTRALSILALDRATPVAARESGTGTGDVIIGRDPKMLEVFKTIGLLCCNRATVFIRGETGTGKELIARVIHASSPYKSQPLITVDCSALVESLLESELFGHEKGAFTGATQTQRGKIELAGDGTLFLDEVGEMPLSVQGKLLGFLQRRTYMRVGGQETLKSGCRIIAATHRDLGAMVQEGSFREDLYFRLRVVSIYVPPLRERLECIPDLATHFLRKINAELGTEVTFLQPGVVERLRRHPWNGNVRELENVLVESVIRARGKVLLVEDVDRILSNGRPLANMGFSAYRLSHVEREHIQQTLASVGWNRSQASRLLGISLPTLRSKIKRYGLHMPPGAAA